MEQFVQKGVSLLETLTCIALIIVLLSLAMPTLSQWAQHQRHDKNLTLMLTTLNLARSKAISTGHPVTVCAGNDECSGNTQWQGAILTFQDSNQNGTFEPTLESLFNIYQLDADERWQWSNFRNKSFLTYKPNGTTHSLNGTLQLCITDHSIYSIKINTSGRSRTLKLPPQQKCPPTVSPPISATHP